MSFEFSHCLVFETSSEPKSVVIGKYHKIQAFPTGTLVESCENQLTILLFCTQNGAKSLTQNCKHNILLQAGCSESCSPSGYMK